MDCTLHMTPGGGRGHGVTKSVVTVNHRMAEKSGVNILPTEVTISMANERLGQMSEVVFSIQEGSFYNCVMPGITDIIKVLFSKIIGNLRIFLSLIKATLSWNRSSKNVTIVPRNAFPSI